MVSKYINKKKISKKIATQKEIFFLVCSGLTDCGYSSKLTYLLLKRQFYRFTVSSNNTKAINVKLKLTRSNFKFANNAAILTGFYRAKW